METRLHKFGVLLLNMGGPGGLEDVEDYIFRLLADPCMVRLPLGGLMQQPFARLVAHRRAPKVRQRYNLIGGKSPILEATANQAALLATRLELPVEIAMRYTPPSATNALERFRTAGVNRFIALPLYPQYSTVSTLSSLKDLASQADPELVYRIIDRHFDNQGYIVAMAAAARPVVEQADPALRTHLLFAAHSIPESYIRRGDPYASDVELTMELICSELGTELPHSLAYQSRVGPVKWRGPTLDEALARLAADGVKQLVVQPLSFVSENLETLFDLDIDFRRSCDNAGIRLHRVPTLNDSALYIDALAELVRREIDAWEAADA